MLLAMCAVKAGSCPAPWHAACSVTVGEGVSPSICVPASSVGARANKRAGRHANGASHDMIPAA
eukprot:4218373-Alexandrium_andersonii.AAC.1